MTDNEETSFSCGSLTLTVAHEYGKLGAWSIYLMPTLVSRQVGKVLLVTPGRFSVEWDLPKRGLLIVYDDGSYIQKDRVEYKDNERLKFVFTEGMLSAPYEHFDEKPDQDFINSVFNSVRKSYKAVSKDMVERIMQEPVFLVIKSKNKRKGVQCEDDAECQILGDIIQVRTATDGHDFRNSGVWTKNDFIGTDILLFTRNQRGCNTAFLGRYDF